jgi:hypothetical protein
MLTTNFQHRELDHANSNVAIVSEPIASDSLKDKLLT